jgi:precorrin-8X/cobalt-precorrin-8 methylmutase
MPVFDAYLIVDWSANSTPKTGKDSIWYCLAIREDGKLRIEKLINANTRGSAFKNIRRLLILLYEKGLVILVGFDFPYSYTSGFSTALGIDEGCPWHSIWDNLSSQVRDNDDNANNRFEVASSFNRRITGGRGPFWGCPATRQNPYLSSRKADSALPDGLPEYRISETRITGPQPVWKLYTSGSVGSQSLLGIPRVSALRFDPALRDSSVVWPFETGFQSIERPGPNDWRILHAEIYPSICRVNISPGQIKDRLQVETLARHFADLDSNGDLGALFACPLDLSLDQKRVVETEEGWILGIR